MSVTALLLSFSCSIVTASHRAITGQASTAAATTNTVTAANRHLNLGTLKIRFIICVLLSDLSFIGKEHANQMAMKNEKEY
jgi:uncharacterized membrane protein YoaK (UPF0700 family)